jgi:PAS domain S-box-containing protein
MAPKSEAASDRPLDSERQASQNRRELLESLFAHVADAIFLIGASGDIIDVNPAACVILGYRKEELLGTRAWDLVASASREEIVKLMDGIERDVPVTVQGIFQGRTGEQIPMELRLTRFGCPNHDLFAVSCRDLTEQEPLEERLRDLSEGRKTEEELRRVNTELSNRPRICGRSIRSSSIASSASGWLSKREKLDCGSGTRPTSTTPGIGRIG